MSSCLLLLMLVCSPSKPANVLTGVHATAAFADTWSTQRTFTACARYSWHCWEQNPITRPFQTNGQPLAYTSTYWGSVGAAWVGNKMHRSNNRVIRRLWWVPQVVGIGAHAYGINHNLGLVRRMERAR